MVNYNVLLSARANITPELNWVKQEKATPMPRQDKGRHCAVFCSFILFDYARNRMRTRDEAGHGSR